MVWQGFTEVSVGSPGRQLPLTLQSIIKNDYMNNTNIHILTQAIVDTYWAAHRPDLYVVCMRMFEHVSLYKNRYVYLPRSRVSRTDNTLTRLLTATHCPFIQKCQKEEYNIALRRRQRTTRKNRIEK